MTDEALAHELDDDAVFHDIADGEENAFWWNDDRVSFRSSHFVLL